MDLIFAGIVLEISGLAVFALGIYALSQNRGFLYAICLIICGISISIATLGISQNEFMGKPLTAIDKGEYKIAFVYMAGENVSVGIEENSGGENESEHLFLYQFPKSAFDSGSINPQAKKLTVVESGKFKKLMLE